MLRRENPPAPSKATSHASKDEPTVAQERPRPLKRGGKAVKQRSWLSPAAKVLLVTLLATTIFMFYVKPRMNPKAEPNTQSPQNETFQPYKVVEIPGKGKGMIATRDIKRGELLLREKPLLLIPYATTASPAEFIQTAVANLSPEGRGKFYSLSHAELDSPEEELALSIVQTNAISAGPEHIGIFPETARLNHGCSRAFNAVYNWREAEEILVVHMVQDVKKGEELLTTYTDTKRPRHERREYLSSNYFFDCTCAVCSLPEPLSRESDKRLQAMTKLYAKLRTWGMNEIDGIDAIATVKQIWNIGEEEGYVSERGVLASDAAHVAASHSDAEATIAWSRMAAEWFGYELGADSEQVESVQSISQNPRAHRAWGTKKTMKVGGPGS